MKCKQKLNKEKTGQNLHNLIVNSEYTYEYLAEFLQLNSPRVIYEWTKGTKMPSLENLVNLAMLFNVQIEDILVI